jgi:predicted TIM-barrel fold metal-dependent hydrolase
MLTKATIVERVRNSKALIDAHTHIGIDVASFYSGYYPYAITTEDHIVRMDVSKIGFTVTFPLVYTSYFQLQAYQNGVYRRDPRSGVSAPYEAENRHALRELCEDFPEFQERFLPFAFFDPSRRQAEQVANLRSLAKEYPLFGLKTASTYLHAPILDLLGKGACLLDFAAENDLPVTLHSAVLPGDAWAQVADILKVVEARPDVRFAIAHTCRFDRRALDRANELPNCFVDCSAFHIHCLLALRKRPSVALGKAQFPAPYANHAEALQLIAETYPDTLIWGTDTPAHYWKGKFRNEKGEWVRSDLPCGPLTEIREFRKLPRKLQARIGHANTVRYLFGAR